MAAGATYEPIATTTASGSVSFVTFSSISASYTDLILVTNCGCVSGAAALAVQMGTGSLDTATNYSTTWLSGNGTNAASGRVTSNSYLYIDARVVLPLSVTANAIIQFQNYKNTTTYKTILSRYNDAAGETVAGVGLWRSTGAINTIKIYNDNSNNFVSGSTFTLYGIAAA